MAKKKVITPVVLLLSMVSLLADVASEMLYPIMPLYLAAIGFDTAGIGLLEGMAEAVAGLTKGYFGRLSDRLGARLPFVRAGYVLSQVSKPLMGVAVWPPWVFFIRLSDRLGKGVRTAARDAMLSAETEPQNKGRVFGFHRAMDSVGASIGPLIALWFLQYFPGEYASLFLWSAIPGLISIGLVFLVRERRKVPPKEIQAGSGFFNFLRYWPRAGMGYRHVVGALLLFSLFNSSDAFLLLRMREAGLTDTELILVYVFYNLIYALLAYPAGIAADFLGMKLTMTAGLVTFAIVYFCFPLVSDPFGFGMLFLGYGLFAACTDGVGKAWISRLSRQEEMATAIGFYTSLSSISLLLASTWTGLVWKLAGSDVAFVVSGIGAAVAAGMLLFAPERGNVKV